MKHLYQRSQKNYLQKIRFLSLSLQKAKCKQQYLILRKKMQQILHEVRFMIRGSVLKKALGISLSALFIGGTISSIQAQDFLPPVKKYAFEVDSLDTVIPNLVDIDNDGDLDILGSFYDYSKEDIFFAFVENTGTADNAKFKTIVPEPFGLESGGLLKVGTLAFDAEDLDKDGDMDIIGFGRDYYGAGHMTYAENVGTLESPEFDQIKIFEYENDNLIAPFASTALADIDEDGDFDILTLGLDAAEYYSTGQYLYSVGYYENISSDDSIAFKKAQLNPFSIEPIMGDSIPYTLSFLNAADFDNDGDIDLFSLNSAYEGIGPEAFYFENLGDQTFSAPIQVENVGDFLNEGAFVLPTNGDIDGDGDIDILFDIYSEDENINDPLFTDMYFVENRIENSQVFEFVELTGNFVLAPNVVSNEIRLDFELEYRADLNIYVLNSNGQVVQQEKLKHVKNGNHPMETVSLPTGNYYMKLVANGKVKTMKFIKQ